MNYHHLTIEERSCIRKYYDGLSYREIARLIGRNVSTVSREIRAGTAATCMTFLTYYPHTAQKKYLLRRSYCHRGCSIHRKCSTA